MTQKSTLLNIPKKRPKLINRQAHFIFSPKQQTIGGIIQRGDYQTTYIDITDSKDKLTLSGIFKPKERAKELMSLLSKGQKSALAAVSPLIFHDVYQQAVFQIKPIDIHGRNQLSIYSEDVSQAMEIRILLSMITLMLWWQEDSFS